MAPSFGRSISFPLSPSRSSSSSSKAAARHVRSISLPSSRAHPLLAHLHNTNKAAAASSDEEKEIVALERLEDLDECIAEMEAGSDKVFRSILHTRVALLNIHTQTC